MLFRDDKIAAVHVMTNICVLALPPIPWWISSLCEVAADRSPYRAGSVQGGICLGH